MGRKPVNNSMVDLDSALLDEINRAIDSAANASARSIYDQFDLHGRGINERTFRKYVHDRRSGKTMTPMTSSPATTSDGPESLIDSLMTSARASLEANNYKAMNGLSAMLRALLDHKRLDFDAAANERAEQLHESKMEAWYEKKRKADDQVTAMADRGELSREAEEAIKRVYGIE